MVSVLIVWLLPPLSLHQSLRHLSEQNTLLRCPLVCFNKTPHFLHLYSVLSLALLQMLDTVLRLTPSSLAISPKDNPDSLKFITCSFFVCVDITMPPSKTQWTSNCVIAHFRCKKKSLPKKLSQVGFPSFNYSVLSVLSLLSSVFFNCLTT